MTTRVEDIAASYVARVFEEHGLVSLKGTPAWHEADPCEGCGTPLWSMTRPHEGDQPVVRVALYRDKSWDTLCTGCQEIQIRYPEMFAFVVRTAEWRANRRAVEDLLSAEPNPYVEKAGGSHE